MKILLTLFGFLLALSIGALAGLKLAPQFVQKKLEFVDEKTQEASIKEIALRIVDTTEISAQSYANIMLPEAKKEVARFNANYEKRLEEEEFWTHFKKSKLSELESIDKQFFQQVANSLVQFNKGELLEYLNLSESGDVKAIQTKITEYMKEKYPLDVKTYHDRLKILLTKYYESKKTIESAPVPSEVAPTEENLQPKEN